MPCKHLIPPTPGRAETAYGGKRIALGRCRYGLPYEDQAKCIEFSGRKKDGSECHGLTGEEWVEFDPRKRRPL
jgi:hypothetical protein